MLDAAVLSALETGTTQEEVLALILSALGLEVDQVARLAHRLHSRTLGRLKAVMRQVGSRQSSGTALSTVVKAQGTGEDCLDGQVEALEAAALAAGVSVTGLGSAVAQRGASFVGEALRRITALQATREPPKNPSGLFRWAVKANTQPKLPQPGKTFVPPAAKGVERGRVYRLDGRLWEVTAVSGQDIHLMNRSGAGMMCVDLYRLAKLQPEPRAAWEESD